MDQEENSELVHIRSTQSVKRLKLNWIGQRSFERLSVSYSLSLTYRANDTFTYAHSTHIHSQASNMHTQSFVQASSWRVCVSVVLSMSIARSI